MVIGMQFSNQEQSLFIWNSESRSTAKYLSTSPDRSYLFARILIDLSILGRDCEGEMNKCTKNLELMSRALQEHVLILEFEDA